MIDGFQYSNEDSYHLLHIAAGQHDTEISQFDVLPASWDPKWEHVSKRLAEVSVVLCSQECCGTKFSMTAPH